ncbi:XRE family transcriptional regulator [Desulfurispirillum indicum]|uniref:Helix-turn-helix domain protein n=1 Tax=Desulfurispirillum indicum (strain ATCC BAA-1389 / DSM 22839 / S5) TaxID=653733 RepID=E6W0W7_DESIS|nr:helix-turn-helix domain-containing protein [Desulfurispirillum indicum]ADU65299.1 helix-turn-helix domain protein [Desulfurispirillum indicum S5]UCZ57196.1 XRE family transcriptional regulator [Desulfurispirillum indicum]
MNISEIIGRKIRIIRKSKRLSSEKLGEAVGIEGSYVRQIETGKRKLNLIILERLASALEVNIAALFDPQLPVEKKDIPAEERLDLINLPVFEGVNQVSGSIFEERSAVDYLPVSQVLVSSIPNPKETAVWVKVNDESMLPLLNRGDLVLLNRISSLPVPDGTPLLAVMNEDIFLGRIYSNKGIVLLASMDLSGQSIMLPNNLEEDQSLSLFQILWKMQKLS